MSLKYHIEERAIVEARLLIYLHERKSSKATIRGVRDTLVSIYGSSSAKTTIHKDLTITLPQISPSLFNKVDLILQENARERASRGGAAFKAKYSNS